MRSFVWKYSEISNIYYMEERVLYGTKRYDKGVASGYEIKSKRVLWLF